ncbi:MAG: M48 family metalloprotease [Flavobacterium sp.]|uniref:M48 family metalloprotease n=1 Tax=Flavobacterium sp. TaxID=239 RepID=UPI00391CAE8F
MNYKLYFKFLSAIIMMQNFVGFSQNYTPIDTLDSVKRELLIKEFEKRNKDFLNDLKIKLDSKTAKFAINNYSDFNNQFIEEINRGKFIFNEELSNYIHSIFSEIKKSNPQLGDIDIELLIAKDHSLNAYCIANGTFVLNLGLFYWLDNEDQIAGVLSHELAHKLLDHSLKKQQRLFIENKNAKQKISSLKKEKYKVSEKLIALLKDNLYENGERSKKQEFEADSLGYIIYRKTKFSKNEYLATLRLMHKYDSIKPIGLSQNVYRKYFNLPNQPFDEKWLLKEDFSSYDYTKFNETFDRDSIASHPETEERILKLITHFEDINTKLSSKDRETNEFKRIKKISYLEHIPNLYFNEEYGLAVYASLLYLERDKENEAYFKEWLGKSFLKILDSRKKYTLNRYVDRLIPNKQSESYQQFLNFIWNLKISEIQQIADFYNVKN